LFSELKSVSELLTKKFVIPFEKKIFWQFSLEALGATREFIKPFCSLLTTIYFFYFFGDTCIFRVIINKQILRNASNDFTFHSVNRLWDTFTPSSRSTSTPLRKKNDDKISLINNNHCFI
jgi:hypothetical protein